MSRPATITCQVVVGDETYPALITARHPNRCLDVVALKHDGSTMPLERVPHVSARLDVTQPGWRTPQETPNDPPA